MKSLFSQRPLKWGGTGLALGLAHSLVSAQGITTAWTISYAPVTPASVPTLSEWGLLVLALVMAVGTAWSLHKKAGRGTTAVLALATALVLGTVTGQDVVGRAEALPLPAPTLSLAGGGTTEPFSYWASVNPDQGLAITNTSGVPQRITAITLTVNSLPATPDAPTNSPQCTVGLVLPAGQSCYVTVILAT